MSRLRRELSRHRVVLLVMLFGAAVRIVYMWGTPYDVRGHDVFGHIDYIKYVAAHWSAPPPHLNSQFYHPPLYYFLMAPAYTIGHALQWSDARILFVIQLFSLACSIAVLGIILWIGTMLHPKKRGVSFLCYGLIAATFPGLVFFAARINNDVLYHLLAFGALAFILRFWKRHAVSDWIAASALIGLGIMTKTHVALLIPLALLCLALHRPKHWMTKAELLALMGVLIFGLGGWFHVLRFFSEGNVRTTVLGNVNILTNFVRNGARTYLTFNPVEILRHPFNDPFQDDERRQFFWEYLFRSAFFGEFNFGAMLRLPAQMILSIAMLLIPFTAGSFVSVVSRWNKRDLPLIALTVLLVIAACGFRFIYPYSSSQDFRYSVLLVVPLAYFASIPMRREPKPLVVVRLVLVNAFITLSSAMLLFLPLA